MRSQWSLAPWLSPLVFLLLPLTSAVQHTCPFNPLCTCVSQPLDVTCYGVPFGALPSLPLEDLYQVEVAKAGLEILQNDALGGSRVSSLRVIQNDILDVAPLAFRGTEHFLTSIDASFNKIEDVPVEAIRNLAYLQWLNLHSNQIETVDSGMFWSLEARSSVRSLFLGQNKIAVLHDGCFVPLSNLTSLDIEGNRLVHLEGRPFPAALNRLSLRDNLLPNVPSTALANLDSLSWLQLGGNLIRHLPRKIQLPVNALLKLDLSHNLLTHLNENIFNNTLTVHDLHLDFNFVRVIPARAFLHLGVERLSISNNRLVSIADAAFAGVTTSLRALDLSYNMIEKTPQSLKTLLVLRQLYLRANELRRLDHLVFYGFRDTLEVLDLSENRLKAMPLDALSVLKKLGKLNMQGNGVKYLGERDFHGWGTTLVSLNLDSNAIQNLAADAFLFTPKLRELKLSFNRFTHPDPLYLQPLRGKLEILELGADQGNTPIAHRVGTQHMEKVEWLQLNHNELRSISSSGLAGYPALVHLDLAASKISYIKGLFNSKVHVKLSNVLLSYNAIEGLETKTFSGLPQLANVMLLANRIRYVSSRSFVNLPNLHTVILAANSIGVIEDEAFTNLTRLTNLYLQENRLTKFSWGIFEEAGGGPIFLNVSSNNISLLHTPSKYFDNLTRGDAPIVRVRTLDLSRNEISHLPRGFLTPVGKTLQHLFLSHNRLNSLRDDQFAETNFLQVVWLNNNNISVLSQNVFKGCPGIQVVHLSGNRIASFHSETFLGLTRLRILGLSDNNLSGIPIDAFTNTVLERLDVSRNALIKAPLAPLQAVRYTLRYLDFSGNHVAVLPASELSHLVNLLHLNASRNRIGGLSEDTFKDMDNLFHLDLSHNPIWRLERGPLEPLKSLRNLDLTNTSLATVPVIPLRKLRKLLLADNKLTNISDEAFREIVQLRYLDISRNMFNDIPYHLWKYLHNLLGLDISYNPIETIEVSTFHGLNNLEELDMRGLSLRVMDTRALHQLKFLSYYKTTTYPNLRAFRLHDVLAKSESLKRILVELEEASLSHQLQWTFGAKLRELTVTGRKLENIMPDAFLGLHHTHELILRITGTSVRKLPHYLVRYLADVRYLTLDIRNNLLKGLDQQVIKLSPVSKDFSTKHITGGVLFSDNPWICTCEMTWIGQWLRRWMRETVRVQLLQFDAALSVHVFASRSTCRLPDTNEIIPLIDLTGDVISCEEEIVASSSSGGAMRPKLYHGSLLFIGLWYPVTRLWTIR